MTNPAYKPDPRFFKPDGAIDYAAALAAGREARSKSFRNKTAAGTAALATLPGRVLAGLRAAFAQRGAFPVARVRS